MAFITFKGDTGRTTLNREKKGWPEKKKQTKTNKKKQKKDGKVQFQFYSFWSGHLLNDNQNTL